MTDKMTVHPLKQIVMGVSSAKVALVALFCHFVLAQPVHAAEQEWWFDVEVILFERNVESANISEKFKQSRLEQPPPDFVDLLTPYLKPDLSYLRAGLPYCRASNQLTVQKQYAADFAFPLPTVKINESSSQQPDEVQEQQQQQTNQDLAINSDATPEEGFQYEVATTDIFTQSDDTISLAQTTDVEDVSPSYSEPINSDILGQQGIIELAAEFNLTRPPIQVDFIEWQVPSEFPCAYAEQIDPSFAAINTLQNQEFDTQPDNQIKRVPEIVDGVEWQQKRGAFLLPTATKQMGDLYEKIKRQRDITPILHLNWRQEVTFGREDSQTFRLFAGQNYAQQFDGNGEPLVEDTDRLFDSLNQPTDEFYIPLQELAALTQEQKQALLTSTNGERLAQVKEDIFARITAALADETPLKIDLVNVNTEQQTTKTDSVTLKELWQLDGGITVYLRNVGRIPYLHIDSNLDFRQPIFAQKKAPKMERRADNLSDEGAIAVNQLQQANYLQSVNFNQLRRVISKQVHYFDHPLFGMVVRINRYRWPEVKQETDLTTVNSD
jgi:hypothetical protein